MPEAYGLYVVMTNPVVGYERCAEAAVAEGVRYVQLRMKNAPRAEVLKMAHAVRAVTVGSGTRFIVNDDVSVAMEVDADGVHLGRSDMPLDEARALWDTPGKIFGLSTHSEEQQREAYALRPDYIGIGPIHATPTKVIPDPVIGYERMERMVATCPLEYVCIGGITLGNLDNLLKRGVENICSVRPIMQSDSPRDVIRTFMDRCRSHPAG